MDYLWILLAASLAASAVGWIYFIYFFSIGYGLSIAMLATATAIIFASSITTPSAIFCCTLFIYGLRLAGYLFLRERKSISYRKILYQPDSKERKPTKTMILIWISCALLYIGQISPVTFYLYNTTQGKSTNSFWIWLGTAIAITGVTIEIIADAHKSMVKKRDAKMFVRSGLYRIVRCPNYFGEIVLWTGSLTICFGAQCTPLQWIIASLGYIGILYVMFSGARRLELRQAETYGNNPEFQKYIRSTPLIIPFAPIYSLAKLKWLRA
jgi:steroid 5-alpha reductase family enzyme